MFVNKTILVAGGTRGIGAQIVKMFASHGAYVICTGRDQVDLNERQKIAPDNI